MTYFIQIRYAQTHRDYYIDADSVEAAKEEAKEKFIKEKGITEGNQKFVNAVA